MEQNLNNNTEIKARLINFYKENKIKVQIILISIIIIIFLITFLEINKEKKNNSISEQYINAGIFYTKNEKDKAKEIYEDILKTNHSFYTTLALNNLLEKNLERNKNKVLEYFDIVEKLQKNEEQKDILKFKKALYLLKNLESQEAKKLLNELIDNDSKIKKIAEEALVN